MTDLNLGRELSRTAACGTNKAVRYAPCPASAADAADPVASKPYWGVRPDGSGEEEELA